MKNNNSTLLDEAKRAMAHWRATRTKRRPIPEQIWDAVLPLINQYTYSRISQELIPTPGSARS